ncbi:MAG: hypothetical protein QGH34_02175 [Candidatus Woesearchaeota archaeon]|jgi:hypothetical protein|nr:hypothetical protein [Candidatus Woesearchaeota archaeon]|tara:strand:- start:1533 stop:1766 length:234 start_codon:yes stop_codon:yes gene_type:complete
MKLIAHSHHRLYIAGASVLILFIGIFWGAILAENLGVNAELVDFEAIKIGLMFTTIIVLLIIGSLILELGDILKSKK